MTRKDELLEFGPDEPEMLYAILSKLPKPLDLEALISRTTLLFSQYPPETLPFRAWSKVSTYSVLKTTRDPMRLARQTLNEGEILLHKHSVEIERQQARQKMIDRTRFLVHRYRRPAGALTLAVAIGILSMWIKSGNGFPVWPSAVVLGAKRIWWVFGQTLSSLRI